MCESAPPRSLYEHLYVCLGMNVCAFVCVISELVIVKARKSLRILLQYYFCVFIFLLFFCGTHSSVTFVRDLSAISNILVFTSVAIISNKFHS